MPQQKGMATAWERGGLVGDDAAVGYSQIDSKNKPHPRVGQLAAARKRLEDLETIADWREDSSKATDLRACHDWRRTGQPPRRSRDL
jgi:hypothetical protein